MDEYYYKRMCITNIAKACSLLIKIPRSTLHARETFKVKYKVKYKKKVNIISSKYVRKHESCSKISV